jgi:hypothetical protein
MIDIYEKPLSTDFYVLLGEVHFWPSNYWLSLFLAMQLENEKSLATKLSIL